MFQSGNVDRKPLAESHSDTGNALELSPRGLLRRSRNLQIAWLEVDLYYLVSYVCAAAVLADRLDLMSFLVSST
mgnify:CR=1 FL=1